MFWIKRVTRVKPVAIIANTVKEKGLIMENNPKWHSGSLSDENTKPRWRI
jgi:transketolase